MRTRILWPCYREFSQKARSRSGSVGLKYACEAISWTGTGRPDVSFAGVESISGAAGLGEREPHDEVQSEVHHVYNVLRPAQ